MEEESAAALYKRLGDQAHKDKHYDTAVERYTRALELSPGDPKLFSNRSASYAFMGKYRDAKHDAEECVKMDPEWFKGYFRLGAALEGLGRFHDAVKQFELSVEKDPQKSARSRLEEAKMAESAASQSGMIAGAVVNSSSNFCGTKEYKLLVNDVDHGWLASRPRPVQV